MRLLRVHIPTRRYLKKFITFYEGEHPIINNLTPFRRYVFALLDKGVIRDESYVPKWLAVDQTNETLTVQVTERTFSHIGHTVTAEKAAYINAFLNSQFDSALTMAGMNLHHRKGVPIKHALMKYCEMIGIEVEIDISIENLLKKWRRTLDSLEPARFMKGAETMIRPDELSIQQQLFVVPELPQHASNYQFASAHRKKNVTEFLADPHNQLDLFSE